MPESERPGSVFDMPGFTPAAPAASERPMSVFTVHPSEPAEEPAEEIPAVAPRRASRAAGQADAATTEEGSKS